MQLWWMWRRLARALGGSTALLQVTTETGEQKHCLFPSHCIVGVGAMYRKRTHCRNDWAQQHYIIEKKACGANT